MFLSVIENIEPYNLYQSNNNICKVCILTTYNFKEQKNKQLMMNDGKTNNNTDDE